MGLSVAQLTSHARPQICVSAVGAGVDAKGTY
jgi:hypothetical protein